MANYEDMAQLTPPVGPQDHIQGSETAKVTLVEYGDYECPYCGQAYPIVKELQRRMGDQLRFVFRNFPLSNMHPHAEHAAEAAEAANAQGKFWQMHDYLYEHQNELGDSHLAAYAGAVGLDVSRFTHEMREHLYASHVHEDFESGVRSGVNGTPTFYINGIRHNGSFDLDTLLQAVRNAEA
jgi:protein-disulfide isomerase